MAVRFGLRGGPTTINRRSVTDLHHIMNPLLLTVDMFALIVVFMFSVLMVCYKDDCLGYQISAMMPFMVMRHHKRHDLS